MRRLIGLVVLFSVAVFSAEPGIGALRDAAVHHEDGAAALAHAVQGDLGHHLDDGGPGGRHSPGTGHQHGTLNDHCTHQHSVVPGSAVALATDLPRAQPPLPIFPVRIGGPTADFFHPPRA